MVTICYIGIIDLSTALGYEGLAFCKPDVDISVKWVVVPLLSHYI